jgi:putative transposase
VKTSVELSERQREQALERFAVIRSCVEEGVSQAEVARVQGVSSSTVRRWIKRNPRAGVGGSGARGTGRSRA